MKISRVTGALVALLSVHAVRADDIATSALRELSAKKVKVFDAAESKYRGPTHFKISYPESWAPSPLARPGVLARIASANGEGMDALIVLVNKGDPNLKDPTPAKVFTEEFFSKFSLQGSTVLRRERLKEGAFDGAVFEYFLEQVRPPMKVRTYVTNFIFTQEGALVQLQGYVLLSEKPDQEADAARIAAFKPVWQAILATLKFE